MELRQTIAEMSAEWPGNVYEPLHKNCNHFTDYCCQELVGHKAPEFINRFSRSCFVKGVFYRCLVPLSKCLDRFALFNTPSITYKDDEVLHSTSGDDLGIEGARGINEVLVESATFKKNLANAMFKNGSYTEARADYLKAVGYLTSLSHRTNDQEQVVSQARSVRIALFLNIAACDLKLSQYGPAVENCEIVLKMDATNHKARYRRGVAFSRIGRLEAALADLRWVLTVTDAADGGTIRDIRREIDTVKGLMEEEKSHERSVARKMLGGLPIGKPASEEEAQCCNARQDKE